MNGFTDAMAQVRVLKRKFDTLLEKARDTVGQDQGDSHHAGRLREFTGFGSNPGALRMLAYVPDRLPKGAPLVVALHGCGQTADDYDRGAGWSALADRLGFAVLYPEQQPANNPKNCFSWFLPGDIARDRGEAYSIRQMVEYAVTEFGSDRRRIFVTGLSAGGAMASVMLAAYPDVFAGGAIIAGLPYGCARSVQQAFDAMFTDQTHSTTALGDRVRAASSHRGPWPKISIWHGTADPIVKPSNAENIVRQWSDVHGIAATPSYQEQIGRHVRRVWSDAAGEPLIEAFLISGMAHGVPLSLAPGKDRCGAAGAFFLDAGISSTHHIARMWRLQEGVAELTGATTMPPPPRAAGPAVVAAETGPMRSDDLQDERFHPNSEPAAAFLDPAGVIAAAFKAAGLPAPDMPRMTAAARVAPGPFIQAALKAAGLRK